jgi:hypothetical protein
LKSNLMRIAYFTRKAARYSRQRKPRRFERLIAYKKELNRRLTEEKLRWRPARWSDPAAIF